MLGGASARLLSRASMIYRTGTCVPEPNCSGQDAGLTSALQAVGHDAVDHSTGASPERGFSTRARGKAPRPPSSSPVPAAVHRSQTGQLAEASSPWEEVVHQETGQKYYWNRQTGATTALGEPRPGPDGRVKTYHEAPMAINRGTSLLGLVGMGAGVGLVFALLGRIF